MYSTVYTPGTNGYSSASTASSAQSSAKKKGTGSKATVIAISVVAFLLLALVFSSIGFLIAGSRVFMQNEDPQIVDTNNPSNLGVLKDEGKTDESVKDSDSQSPSESANIIKTESPALNEAAGTVGKLMTKTQVAALVKDSVVEISTEQVVKGHSFMQYVQSGAGSGVIISDDGMVITNNHVINGASKITVRLTNGNEYVAELIGTDASSDIAIIKIKAEEKLTVATLGSSANLSLAEDVLVIGNPLGELGGTVTDGIVSALAREITIDGENMTLIQTNAAVNPGNSGGGMFNLYGELVGIVNAKSSGEDVEGLGFAIPIDTAYSIVLQLLDYGYVRGRVDHGLELIDINDLFTAASYRVSALGVYVYESKYTDDIKNGDRIASVNGIEVSTSAKVKEALYGCEVGDTVDITVVRGGKLINVKLTLHEYVPETDVSFGR